MSDALEPRFSHDFDSDGRRRMAEQLRGTGHDQDNPWIFDRITRVAAVSGGGAIRRIGT
ncbi:MAG TPA: hypothetical protein VFS20_03505 [Longimicrobium sp.]|nr:hypothetical protein [Longimicrobium sp.]